MPPHVKVTLTENEARALSILIMSTVEFTDLANKWDRDSIAAVERASMKISNAMRAKNLATFAGGS